MDKEALEKEIEKLLKEQEEIRVLVAENRKDYWEHLVDNLSQLSYLYFMQNDYQRAQITSSESDKLLIEICNNFLTTNARPLNTPL